MPADTPAGTPAEPEVRELDVVSHGVRLSARHHVADDRWATAAGRPCVIMAHGFGGTMDTGLEPFAERFAAAGADVVRFDYRGFGLSDGEPRQLVHHRRHRADYRAVVAHVRAMDGIDPDRVVLWGSSYSGGHVIAVGAEDPRLAGVISQGAAMDGVAETLNIARYGGVRQLLRVVGLGLAGTVARSRTVPIVGPPGSRAPITSPDAVDGYGRIAGPTFRNEMLAWGIPLIALNRPVAAAGKLRVPLMLVIAEADRIAVVSSVEEVARRALARVRVLRLDVGHFDIYVDEPFETSVTQQVDFLGSVVGVAVGNR